MPQPKSTPKSSSGRARKGARGGGAAKRDDESVARGIAALREVLTRAVMLPTERVREAMDDAVRRGRMTRSDAEELAQSLIAIGRRQTEELLAELEGLVGKQRSTAADVRKRTQQATDRVSREVDRARRAAGLSSAFPITGYDDLAAAQITARLDELTPAELRQVRDYERRHGNRKTVLSAVERKLG
jgi:polyhydroxyalkanoate synthesis regulator phasin